jgi:hypothetical protein
VAIGYHSAPLGVCLRDAGRLLIAERGSFGGGSAGCQISTISADLSGFAPLITGFVNSTTRQRWGRPVDVQMVPRRGAGHLDAFFVSDDESGSILRFEQA